MTDHFNKLSPAHHELLTKVFEEASEVIKVIAKIMLHGLDSVEPGQPWTNKEKLESELGDLQFFIRLAAGHRVVSYKEIAKAFYERGARKNHYLHHVEID